MKTAKILLISMILLSTTVYGVQSIKEDFKERVFIFLKKGEMSKPQMDLIWLRGDSPDSESASTIKLLNKLIKKQVDQIEFISIPSDLQKSIDSDTFKVGKVHYAPNLKSYSFVKFHYKKVNYRDRQYMLKNP
tara:strand:+ start:1114 stop:1512 length:399 start_codon:yes stop_codon:yes gene_type:complete